MKAIAYLGLGQGPIDLCVANMPQRIMMTHVENRCVNCSPDRAENSRSTATTTLLSAYRSLPHLDDAATSSLRSDGSLMLDERRFNEDGSFIGQYATLDRSGSAQNGSYQPVREAL